MWTDLLIPISSVAAVVLPVGGYMMKAVITAQAAPIKTALEIHEASDAIIFKNIATQLDDLKNGQTNQTEKLDRIVEKLL